VAERAGSAEGDHGSSLLKTSQKTAGAELKQLDTTTVTHSSSAKRVDQRLSKPGDAFV